MFVGRPYNQAKLDAEYDVIVIGSGISGLTTAALLAKEGKKKVLVLEAHYTAGGYSHTYKRKGYEWDVGIHYVGWVDNPRHPMTEILNSITGGRLKWESLGDTFDTMAYGNDLYRFRAGSDNYLNSLVEHFPGERKAIKKFQDLARVVERKIPYYFADRVLPTWIGKIISPLLRRGFLKYASKTTGEVIASITSNKKLAAVLASQWGDYGLPPGQGSYAMHAVTVSHYRQGASYPVGGASNIAKSMIPTIEQFGGQVLTNAKVESILVNERGAFGVKLTNGHEIRSKVVVSSAGIPNTFGKLLPPEISERFGLKEKSEQVEPSASAIQLMIGLKHTNEELKLPKNNFWIFPSYDHDLNFKTSMDDNGKLEFPGIFMSFPSAKDPEWDRHYPNKSTIAVVSFLPYHLFKKWEHTNWRKRGEDYEKLKKEITTALLERAFHYFPQLRDKIDYCELGTPLSTAHFSLHSKGETYGLAHTPARFTKPWLNGGTPIKNLYLTGQDTCMCGMAGALMSGAFSALKILGLVKGRRILKRIAPWKF
jgi:all-trans-retinol 13,14-reductase